jgi:hypothetical protein
MIWNPGIGQAAEPNEGWPETPGELVYNLDRVLETFAEVQQGSQTNLLEAVLECADWREMFGSTGSGILKPDDIENIKAYYRQKFASVDRYYLAEQLSTELMTALMASGDINFSDNLKQFGRENPELWQEIRAFFGRKEVSTAMLMVADQPGERAD